MSRSGFLSMALSTASSPWAAARCSVGVAVGALPATCSVATFEAEVAAGPEGYLPEMSAVLSDAHSWQAKDATEARPPRSYTLAQLANTRPDATFVPYDPTALIDAAKRDVPGAILSLGAATHVSCALEQPVRRDSRIEKRLIKDQLLRGITRVKRFGAKARAGGARHGMGPEIPPMIRKAIARVGGAGDGGADDLRRQ